MQKKELKIILLVFAVIAIVVIAVVMGTNRQAVETADEENAAVVEIADSQSVNKDIIESVDDDKSATVIYDAKALGASSLKKNDMEVLKHLVGRRTDWEAEEKKDSECVRLSELLDDATDNDAIITQARFLAVSDSRVRRHASVDALNWLGTPEAMDILAELQNDEEEEVADEAFTSMEHFFDTMVNQIVTDPVTGELVCDRDISEYFETCTNAIKSADNIDNSDILLTKTAALDVKLAIPILLDVAENGSSGQREIALRYLDIVTHGDGVTNREEAMLWLLKDQEISTESTNNK